MGYLKSIVIPTYCPTDDVADKLHWFMYSLAVNTDFKSTELIVIEQGIPFFKEWKTLFFKNDLPIIYKHYEQPIGYAKAVNEAVRLSTGAYILIANNDLQVGPDWADKLVRKYKDEYKNVIGLLSACDLPGEEVDFIEEPISWWSCVCIDHFAWRHIGELDEDKLNYRLHDQDWSIRAHNKGYRVGRYHGVRVKHSDSSTYKHMKVDEKAEIDEMIKRWGVSHFCEYVLKGKDDDKQTKS